MTAQFHEWPCTWARPSWTALSPEHVTCGLVRHGTCDSKGLWLTSPAGWLPGTGRDQLRKPTLGNSRSYGRELIRQLPTLQFPVLMQKVVTNHTHTERNSEILNIITKLQKNPFQTADERCNETAHRYRTKISTENQRQKSSNITALILRQRMIIAGSGYRSDNTFLWARAMYRRIGRYRRSNGRSKVSRPTRHKIGHFGAVLHSQSVGSTLKNQNQNQQN